MNRNILLNKTPQLVDLNGDTTNFDITFTVTSKNKEPFYLVVVDQKTLDVNPNFSFRKADEGQLSGNIVSDKNVYQNYFLCLKADEDCEVNIEIIKKEIQPVVVKEEYIPEKQQQHHKEDESFLSRNWKWLLILLIAGGVLLYIWKIKKKDETSSPVESSVPSSPIPSSSIPSSPVESLYNTQENIDYNTSNDTDLNSSFFNNSNTSKNLLQRIQNMTK